MIDFFGEFTFDNEFVGGGEAAFSLNIDVKPSDEEGDDYEEVPNKEVDASAVNDPLTSDDDAVEGEVYNTTDANGNTPIVESSGTGSVAIKGLVLRKIKKSNDTTVTFFQVVLEAITGLEFSGADNDITLSNGLAFQSESGARVNFNLNNGTFTGGEFKRGGKFSFGRRAVGDALYDIEGGITIEPAGAGSFVANDDDLESITLIEAGKITVNGDYKFNFIDPDENSAEVNIKNATGDVVVQYTSGGDTILDLRGLTATSNNTAINVVSAGGADFLIPPADENAIKISGTAYAYTNESGTAQFILDSSSGEAIGFVFAGNGDVIAVPRNADFTYQNEDGETLTFGVSNAKQSYTITRNANDIYAVEIFGSAVVSDNDTTLNFTTSKTLEDGVTVYFDEEGNILSVDGLDNLGASDKMAVVSSEVTSADGGLAIGNPNEEITGYISVSSGDFTYSNGTVKVSSGDTIYSLKGYNLAGTGGTVTDVNGNTYTYGGDGNFVYDEEAGITGFVFKSKDDFVTLPAGGEGINLYYQSEATDPITVPAITGDTGGYTVTLTDNTVTAPRFAVSDLDIGTTVGDEDETITTTKAADAVEFDAQGNITGGELEGTNDFKLPAAGVSRTFTFGLETVTVTPGTNHVTGDVITFVTDVAGVISVSGLRDGDTINNYAPNSPEEVADTTFNFITDGGTNLFYVNGITYRVVGDTNGVLTITGDGQVGDLDPGAHIHIDTTNAIYGDGSSSVNNVPYNPDETASTQLGELYNINGFTKKNTELGSYQDDPLHPLINANDDWDDVAAKLIRSGDLKNAPTAIVGEVDSEAAVSAATLFGTAYSTLPAGTTNFDYSTGEHANDRMWVFLNNSDTRNVTFNNVGNNLAIVSDTADGDKNIVLGDKGDFVIMDGDAVYNGVTITGGAGNDNIVVTNSEATAIDLSKGGNDRIHTFAAANANITLNNYDETSQSGVVIHDPEIGHITELDDAIESGLLTFENGKIFAIDRDEAVTGRDRKSSITINNKDSKHQTMVRLYGYRDRGDSYNDDSGQLVGFTDKTGGLLDASDLSENLILLGNVQSQNNVLVNGNHSAGSSLKSGAGDDTLYGGAGDILDAGAGANQIKLIDDSIRSAATVVAGQGVNTITGLQTGFNGDVLDMSAVSSLATIEYEDGLLTIADESTKSTTTAAVSTEADFIAQTFVSDGTTMKAAIAKDGGTIDVTDANVPTYFVAKDGAINFAEYSGDVSIDVDNDWTNTAIGGESATLLSGFSSLIGGSGNTLFKGGEYNEVLVAGTGESSLYGAGGKNTLVGSTSTDKYGSTEFFVQGINNGAQNVITNFEFIEDGGANTATFDNLNLGMADNNDVTEIKADSDGSISLAIRGAESGHTEKVTIEGAVGKEFLVDRGTTSESVVQIAATEVTINHDYVDFYAATDDSAGATVKVGDVTSTEVWLGGPPADHGTKVPEFTSSRFTVIDATGSSATAIMAGNELSNTIYGGLGNASMWGGEGNANDVMFGGSAHNEFYYEVGNGNDTIMSANDGDIIHLGATLDQVDFDNTNISAAGIEVKFNDGGTLNINSSAEVTFSFDDGTAIKANRQTNQFE